jgi:hypothetical protein
LPQSNNGCTNAHLHYYVVDSSITIKLTSGLSVGTYKICHALKHVDGISSSSTNYWEQTATLSVVASSFLSLQVENAAPNKLTANVNVNLNVTGVTTNDYLSFLPSSTIGCNTAASATSKFTFV